MAAGYDAIADRYRAWAAASDDPGRDAMVGRFESALPAGAAVLDLGCGNGMPTTRRLVDRFRVTAVDVSSRQLAEARRAAPGATFIEADIATLELPAGSFHGVTMLYALSHLPRAVHGAVLARIGAWLRPGGHLLVTMGVRDSPDWQGEWLGTRMFFSAWDEDRNRALVEAAGLDLVVAEVLETREPEGAVPFLWVLARRPEPAARRPVEVPGILRGRRSKREHRPR